MYVFSFKCSSQNIIHSRLNLIYKTQVSIYIKHSKLSKNIIENQSPRIGPSQSIGKRLKIHFQKQVGILDLNNALSPGKGPILIGFDFLLDSCLAYCESSFQNKSIFGQFLLQNSNFQRLKNLPHPWAAWYQQLKLYTIFMITERKTSSILNSERKYVGTYWLLTQERWNLMRKVCICVPTFSAFSNKNGSFTHPLFWL